jgi:hypothetical protein
MLALSAAKAAEIRKDERKVIRLVSVLPLPVTGTGSTIATPIKTFG